MAILIAIFIQVIREVKLEILDLRNGIVLKSCTTDEIYFNLVDRKGFLL